MAAGQHGGLGSRLEQLDREIEALQPRLQAAGSAWAEDSQNAAKQKVYEDLEKLVEKLVEQRGQLQAQLAGGAGPGPSSQAAAEAAAAAAATRGGGASLADAGVTASQALRTPLPEVTVPLTQPSCSGRPYSPSPDFVRLWSRVEPSDVGSCDLPAAIISHQDDGDTIYGDIRLHPQPANLHVPLDSEASVAGALQACAGEQLSVFAQTAAPAHMTPSWHQQPPSAIIQDALIFHSGLMVAGSAEHGETGPSSSGSSVQRPKMDFALLLTPQASALPHPPMGGQHQHQQLQPPRPPLPQPHPVPLPQQPAGAPSSSRPLVVKPHQQQQQVPHMLPVDVQPVTGEQDKQLRAQRQQQQQQQEPKRRCICVGEVKTVARLMDQSQQHPLDLIGAWRDSRHPRNAQAQQVISQLFTYMQHWRILFGYITCFRHTYLAYCQPKDRRTLYLSEPILSSSRHDRHGGMPAVTMLGALAWLQYQALRRADEPVDAYPASSTADRVGGGEGSSSSSGGGGRDADIDEEPDLRHDLPYEPSSRSLSAARASLSSEGSIKQRVQVAGAGCAPSSRSYSAPQPAGALEVLLQAKLCDGSAGAVVHGTCCGTPAVIKLLGPDDGGLAAWRRERDAYRLLAPLQGESLPSLLGAGSLGAGVRFIATAWIEGQPLSSLQRPLPAAVVAAAVRSLDLLHSRSPAFLHGDVRLENILLLRGPAASDTVPCCMVIDFGRSRMDGSTSGQQAEKRRLRELLGLM